MIMSLADPAWGSVTVAGNPMKSSLMSDEAAAPAPLLGADTEAVMREWLGTTADPAERSEDEDAAEARDEPRERELRAPEQVHSER
jgi:crotonobetainyl-CoA:carnitine CoA-transferase CaiB-like acyl-CoA transferase